MALRADVSEVCLHVCHNIVQVLVVICSPHAVVSHDHKARQRPDAGVGSGCPIYNF